MLVALLAFCAGALVSLALLRAAVRRSVSQQLVEELSDRRWQALLETAGYVPRGVARRAAARFEEELARDRPLFDPGTATLTPPSSPAIPQRAVQRGLGVAFRVRD